MTTLGRLIQRHRGRRGLTQAELARRLKSTTQTAISQWENSMHDGQSRPRFDEIAKTFDYPDDMFEWWALDKMEETEKLIYKAQTYKEMIKSRRQPSSALARIDSLIEDLRRFHDELADLRALIAKE